MYNYRMNSTLSTIFSEFAARAVKDFPALKDHLLIYHVPSDTLIGSDLREWKDHCLNKSIAWVKRDQKIRGLAEKINGMNIIYNFEQAGIDATERQDTLQHELGHLIAPFGMCSDEIIAECIANTFSAIRLIQQGHPELLAQKVFIHSYTTIFQGHTDAPETIVLQELQRLSQHQDLTQLTPEQTARLAYSLSLRYAPSPGQMPAIAEIFLPVQTATENFLATCAETMLADHGARTEQAFQLARNALMPFLNHDTELLKMLVPEEEMPNMIFDGPYWNGIRARIKERETPAPHRTHTPTLK